MESCPYLPVPDKPVTAADSRSLGAEERGPRFYELCLNYAQTKLLNNLPAQAILQLNRAFSADLDAGADVLRRWPLPYAAATWILDARPDQRGLFLGNPRRHWQHYATRMSGPRSGIRVWRSWACWWLCQGRLPEEKFPGDSEQIEREGILLPARDEVMARLRIDGLPGEAELWESHLAV